MDSDDISLPRRFEKQFAYMESHPDVIVCGSYVEFFGEHSYITRQSVTDMEKYRIQTLFCNPGPMHPTAFFNRRLLSLYHIVNDEKLAYAQDYGLWTEICRHGQVFILDEVLLRYRIHGRQISSAQREKHFQCDKSIKKKLLLSLLGNVTDEELDLHFRYSSGYYRDLKVNEKMISWLWKLVEANDHTGIYDRKKFRYYI